METRTMSNSRQQDRFEQTFEAGMVCRCCGEVMVVTSLAFGNGWICLRCGCEEYDIASVKMSIEDNYYGLDYKP